MENSNTTIDSFFNDHPAQFFMLGLKHHKVIDNMIYHSEKGYHMLDGLIDMFKKQRNENNPNFNVVGVRNKLLEDIVKARSHLMYLRDNVDEIEFPEGRFEQMNKVGLRFDKLERKLFRI